MERHLVIGLGNYMFPGTRHNAGMMALNHSLKYMQSKTHMCSDWQLKKSALSGWIAECTLNKTIITSIVNNDKLTAGLKDDFQCHLVFFKPKEYMNLSGIPVKKAAVQYGIKTQNILCMHDDLDNEFGLVKVKKGGSANGHNGLRSIISSLGSNSFDRIRIGIGRPANDKAADNFVLSKFPAEQQNTLNHEVFPKVVDGMIMQIIKKSMM